MRVSNLVLPILTTLLRLGPLPERKLWLKSASTSHTIWKKNVLQTAIKIGFVRLNEQTQFYELEDAGKDALLRQLKLKESDILSETAFATGRQMRPMETTLTAGCTAWAAPVR